MTLSIILEYVLEFSFISGVLKDREQSRARKPRKQEVKKGRETTMVSQKWDFLDLYVVNSYVICVT